MRRACGEGSGWYRGAVPVKKVRNSDEAGPGTEDSRWLKKS